jgi:transposase
VPTRYTRPYPPEYRAEAVRLVREGGRDVKEVAESLGVSPESLRLWLKQKDLDSGRRQDGLTSDEREELRRLRRENRDLREDREILKKAAAFFAKETRTR